jgi:primosomal protein N'
VIVSSEQGASSPYARVAVARPLFGATSELTYAIPAHVEVRPGHVVLVPLGPTGETGYVTALVDDPGFDPAKVKAILRVIDPIPAFDDAQLDFFRWIADYYLAPLGQVIAAALPAEIRARVVRILEPTEEGSAALAGSLAEGPQAAIVREVIARPGLTRRGLAQRLKGELDGDAIDRAVSAAARRGWIRAAEREITETKGAIRTVSLAVSPTAALDAVPPPA